LTLGNSSIYTGATTISAGTLALSIATSLGSSTNVTIGSKGTLDVSAISSAYTMPGTAFTASGIGTSTNAAAIKGYSSTVGVTLGALPITLNITPNQPLAIRGIPRFTFRKARSRLRLT